MKFPKWALSDRFFAFLGVLQLIGVGSMLWAHLMNIYLLSWLVWPLLLWWDRRRVLQESSLIASIEVPRNLEIGKCYEVIAKLDIELAQSTELKGLAILSPETQNIRFEQSRIELGNLALSKGHHNVSVVFKVKAHRLGYEKVSNLQIRSKSFLGFWIRHFDLSLHNSAFRIMPVNHVVPPERFFEILSHQRIFQQGSRRVIKSQNPDQFYSVRKYQYPDPLRFIDSKKSAKYGTPMTRTFETFFNHHLIIGLDLSRSMLGQLGNSQKADYYISAALALSESALTARDRVSFFAFSQKVHKLINNSRNASDFLSLYKGSHELTPINLEANYDLLMPTLQSCSGSRSIFVLLTDASRPSVQSSLTKVLKEVASRHLTVVCSLIDNEFSIIQALNEDVPSKTHAKKELENLNHRVYQYWLEDRMRTFKSQINYSGAGSVNATDQEWLNVVSRVYSRLRESTAL